ncbi:hypothetical protein N7495_003682 [Penicillium taxi]|uniref:uncharacterized protein n=1 Tax=Penicillium taxi TaxID=168475 RepID=UPI0025457A06|nr:uncharacterized protein N7495_003682 [Penicillium taxi]KAJ5898938.1 hypothetical protein N7495_003682 [Penicillium taxi]
MFAQQFDHSFNDLFNQYVNMESSGPEKDSFSTNFDQFFPLDSLSSDGGDLPAVSTQRHHQSPQPWAKEWSLQDDEPQFTFEDTLQPSVIPDLGLNTFEVSTGLASTTNRASTSPSTPPTTPHRKVTKSALVTPKSIRHRDPNERRALLRKQSFSPSLMRSSNHPKGRMAYSEAWAQRLQNFSLAGSDDRLPLSPPPSDALIQHETTMNQARDSAEIPPHFYQPSPISLQSTPIGAMARHQQASFSHQNSSALTNSSSPSADDIFSSSHSSDPHSISSWQSDALGTSSLPFTPDLQSHDQTWWSPMSSRVAQQQTHYLQSPTPNPSMQNVGTVGSQNEMLHGGLMIQLDPTFDISADSSFSSNLLPANSQKFVAPFPTHPLHHISSPSLSPKATTTSPKDIRNGVFKATHRRTNSRKLPGQSMNGPKSAKSGSPRGANKSVSVSFVNFTANDSQKILTGVAPSGSSKTKARREQEAQDKRRKLSEAALRAVRNAGGDVEALEAVFC